MTASTIYLSVAVCCTRNYAAATDYGYAAE